MLQKIVRRGHWIRFRRTLFPFQRSIPKKYRRKAVYAEKAQRKINKTTLCSFSALRGSALENPENDPHRVKKTAARAAAAFHKYHKKF